MSEHAWITPAARDIHKALVDDWITSLESAGVTGTHLLTKRWFEAYRIGCEIAQDPFTYQGIALGIDVRASARRFATQLALDIPEAFLLGFDDELERIRRRLE